MIGRVNSRFEATARVRVFGPTGQARAVTTVIDTGYSGSLTLPIAVVRALALSPT
jgi:predicted aspartyl protease